MRLLTSILFLFSLLTSAGFATETSTPINYDIRQSGFKFNDATNVTLSSSEQNIVITVAPGYPVYVQFAPPVTGSNAWAYSLTTGTHQTGVAASQPLILKFSSTTTVFMTSTAGTTIAVSCLTYSVQNQ